MTAEAVQSYRAYYDNGRVVTPNSLPIPNGSTVIITVLDSPYNFDEDQSVQEYLSELRELISASEGEDLNFDDFPRCHFGRDVIDFTEDGETGK